MSVTAGRLRAVRHGSRVGALGSWWRTAGELRTTNSILLVLVVGVLNVVGLVMVLSASTVQSLDSKGTAWWFFERQLLWTGLGVIGFAVAQRIDYPRWRRIAVPLLVVALFFLLVVLVPGVGIYVDGSRRWLGVGSWRFQPSELAKLGVLVFIADLLSRREHELDDWRRVIRPVCILVGVVGLLVMLEPDLASMMVIGFLAACVLVVGGVRLKHLAPVAGLGLLVVSGFALLVPWRRGRMLSFLDPGSSASHSGYQVTQSLIALGHGGLTGVGLGAGRAKWDFLPAAHTDFIFAIIGEELGLIGCALVVGLFAAIAVLGIRTALRAPDRFGMLLAGGITAWIVSQALINIGAVVGVLPVTGVPLPFVSFGGTALVFTMVAAGALTNVARQGRQ